MDHGLASVDIDFHTPNVTISKHKKGLTVTTALIQAHFRLNVLPFIFCLLPIRFLK